MGKNIVVAGLGHGGIVAAALLAEKGFNVTVYEKTVRALWGTIGQICLTLNLLNLRGYQCHLRINSNIKKI